MFETHQGFDREDNLIMIPSVDKFIDQIINTVNQIEISIVDADKILDFEAVIRDEFETDKPKIEV